MIERSRAIKCPTVALQLANTKRVQQALYETPDSQLPHAPLPTIPRETRDSPLSDAALNSESHMAQIRATFVPQVTPDSVCICKQSFAVWSFEGFAKLYKLLDSSSL